MDSGQENWNSQKCRTCYENFGAILIDNEMLVTKVKVRDMIGRCVPIQAHQLDKSNKVCTNCLTVLINFYKFQEKCIKVDEKFRQINRINSDSLHFATEVDTESTSESTQTKVLQVRGDLMSEIIEVPDDSDHEDSNNAELDKSLTELNKENDQVTNSNFELSLNYNGHIPGVTQKNFIVKIPKLKLKANPTEKQVKKYFKLQLSDGALTEIHNINISAIKKPIIQVQVDDHSIPSVRTSNNQTKSDFGTNSQNILVPKNLRFPIFNFTPCPCTDAAKMKETRPRYSYIPEYTQPEPENILTTNSNNTFINPKPPVQKCEPIKRVPVESQNHESYIMMSVPTWISDHNYRPITQEERKQFSRDLRKVKRVAERKSKPLPYQCILCLQHFGNINKLNEHRKVEHKVGPFLCRICNEEFTHVKFVERHQRSHLKRPIIDRCKVCEAEFEDEDLFKEHLKLHPNFVCDKCGKMFNNRPALYAHIQNVHSNRYQSMCNICGLVLKSSKSLRLHIESIHDPPTTRNFRCDECGKEYKTDRYLRKHKKLSHSKNTVSCDRCGKVFRNIPYLNSHIKLMHEDHKPYKCQVCDKEFGRGDYLKKHLKCHYAQNSETATIVCKFCKHVCKSLKQLKCHMKSHFPKRRYPCTECNLTFMTTTNLARHLLIHSDASKQFRCQICFRTFGNEEDLKEHSVNHTNFKYECTFCGEKFARKYLLENHRSNEHMDFNEFTLNEVESSIQSIIDQDEGLNQLLRLS